MSLVLVATSRTICAPMFWKRSGSSISLATVTPSLVTVGEPKDFSSTTLRPLGPRVTATASDSVFTPRRICSRATWWNVISFAGMEQPPECRGRAKDASPSFEGAGNVDGQASLSRASLSGRAPSHTKPRMPLIALLLAAGSLAGKVTLNGLAPKLANLPVTRDMKTCGTNKPDESLEIGQGGAVKDAVIWFTDVPIPGDFKPAKEKLD